MKKQIKQLHLFIQKPNVILFLYFDSSNTMEDERNKIRHMTQNPTRPLVYLWTAEYEDGNKLSQFDPITFKENAFGDIDNSKLKKFGIYSIPKDMEAGIKKTGDHTSTNHCGGHHLGLGRKTQRRVLAGRCETSPQRGRAFGCGLS